jgi:hypothetical protein
LGSEPAFNAERNRIARRRACPEGRVPEFLRQRPRRDCARAGVRVPSHNLLIEKKSLFHLR